MLTELQMALGAVQSTIKVIRELVSNEELKA